MWLSGKTERDLFKSPEGQVSEAIPCKPLLRAAGMTHPAQLGSRDVYGRVLSILLEAVIITQSCTLNDATSQAMSADRGKVVDFGTLVVEGLRAQEQLASQGTESPSNTGEDLEQTDGMIWIVAHG